MRTAVCLHGYFGTISTGDFTTTEGGFEHIKQRVLDKDTEVDFYIHCWQPEFETEIKELYKPKKIILEKQIDFDEVCRKNRLSQKYFDEHFQRNKTIYKNANISRILSFYYSRCESIKLSLNGDYDWVMVTRFDISQRGGQEVNKIRFLIDADNDFLYTTDWNQKHAGS